MSDLAAISEKWLRPCGPCDGGLSMGCTHPDEDPRPVIADLVAEVERLRAQMSAVRVLRSDCASLSRQINAAGRAYGHAFRRIDDILISSGVSA